MASHPDRLALDDQVLDQPRGLVSEAVPGIEALAAHPSHAIEMVVEVAQASERSVQPLAETAESLGLGLADLLLDATQGLGWAAPGGAHRAGRWSSSPR
jgi:hypothetical protein